MSDIDETRRALVNSDGTIAAWGSCDWTPGPGQAVLELAPGALPLAEIPLSDQTVDMGEFVLAGDAVRLTKAKRRRIAQVNRRTEALIGEGVSHGGLTMSLSSVGQFNLKVLWDLRASFAYPIRVGNIDDTAQLELADAAAVDAWFQAATARVLSVRLGGEELRQAIRSAADQAELDAIEDDRT